MRNGVEQTKEAVRSKDSPLKVEGLISYLKTLTWPTNIFRSSFFVTLNSNFQV